MRVVHRLQIESPQLSDRLKAALSEFGKASETGRAMGLTPQKITNYANGHVVSIALDLVLQLEDYLEVDLLGDQRAAVVEDLRQLSRRVNRRRKHQHPVDQG